MTSLDPSQSYTFSMSTLSDREVRKQIQTILRAHNEQIWPFRGPEALALNIYVRDPQGKLLGGVIASTYWGWLVVDILALVEEVRGQGLGKELMRLVTTEAHAHGCSRAHTSTYAHQALGFYQRLGYQIIGKLDDYPEGYTYYWLQKDL